MFLLTAMRIELSARLYITYFIRTSFFISYFNSLLLNLFFHIQIISRIILLQVHEVDTMCYAFKIISKYIYVTELTVIFLTGSYCAKYICKSIHTLKFLGFITQSKQIGDTKFGYFQKPQESNNLNRITYFEKSVMTILFM